MRRWASQRIANWARRRQGPDVPPFVIQSRRIYILPTKLGWGFTAMVVVMLIAGLNYANSAAMFLTFLLGGFGLVSMHQCHRNLLRTKFVSAGAAPMFAGQRGVLRVTLGNEARFIRYGLEVGADLTANGGSSDGIAGVADVQPNGQAQADIAITPTKRGILRIDRLHISTSFPYNLFRAWTWAHLPIEVIVYPRPHGTLPTPMDSGQKSGQRTLAIAGSDEWMGLRPFRDGDSPRQVAWKQYARGAPLMVKEYSALGAELRQFDFAKLPPMETEAKLEQLARWIVDAESRGERYGLRMPGHHFVPDSGPQHRHECLVALALYGAGGNSTVSTEPSDARSATGATAHVTRQADAR